MSPAQQGWAALLGFVGVVLLIAAIAVTPNVTAAGKLGLIAMVILIVAVIVAAAPRGNRTR